MNLYHTRNKEIDNKVCVNTTTIKKNIERTNLVEYISVIKSEQINNNNNNKP